MVRLSTTEFRGKVRIMLGSRPTLSRAPSNGERILFFFGPVLSVGFTTTMLSSVAAFLGWHPELMLSLAAISGAVSLSLLTSLLFWQMADCNKARGALRNVEARVGAILDGAMDAIVSCDDELRVVLFNSAAERVFGHHRKFIQGQPLTVLIPTRFRDRHDGHVDRFSKTGQTNRRMGDQTVLWGLKADGSEFPIEASISQLSESGKKFYTAIIRDISERFQANEALQRSKEQLRKLAAAAHLIREQEKSRIARELHDELGQALTALKIDVGWLESKVPEKDEAIRGKLRSMTNVLDQTVASTRRISADLRPLMLDDLGLLPAAEWLAQNFSERTGIPCEFACNVPELNLESESATAVFRMLQESLTNVARHAGATQVEINIMREPSGLTLTIRDNGLGFAPQQDRKANSFGLLGMEERAYLLGGAIDIASEPGAGTEIEITIPMTGESK